MGKDMTIVERIDEYGKPAWITLMILSFVVFWPLGLFILGYMLWSGRMRCWSNGKVAAYDSHGKSPRGPGRWQRPMKFATSSGNAAFDEYREETLRRLEEEQEEFKSFMERLRQARDKAEFDQFMADRAKSADVTDVEDVEDVTEKPAKGKGRGKGGKASA
ncbi:MAG: DUF2852 domain-containing protein [Hyphomicrobiales bacterium]